MDVLSAQGFGKIQELLNNVYSAPSTEEPDMVPLHFHLIGVC